MIDSVIRSVLAGKSVKRVVLLDVPDYPNVGDPAIFLGELAFFRRACSKIRIDSISSRTYSSELDNVIEMSDALFLQGG